jgi:peptidoglycan/xylan/chitin deacetylase (PgdA/CDA1 family)/glycosyltransferase involved in cell wall biosynthesis
MNLHSDIMRLILITNVFPNPYEPNRGIFNWHMARALTRDHEVRVISPISWVDEWRRRLHGSRQMNRDRSETREGIRIHYPRFYYAPKVLRSWYGGFLWKSVAPTVRQVLQEFAPDAVLGYWVHPDGEVAVRVARLAGVPAVVMSGGSGVLILGQDAKRRRCMINVLNRADAVVTVDQDLKKKIVEFGIASDKVHVIQRGVDQEQFSPGNKEEARRRLGMSLAGSKLLWVGRMVPVKGLDVLMEACGHLRNRGENIELYLVGDGPLKKDLESQCRRRALEGTIRFAGPVEHCQLADWYRAADLTVLPSRSEGIPNVLRESLACGTRFVASRVGGIPEIAHEPANRLVPPGDGAALADAIHQELQRPISLELPRSPTWEDSAKQLTGLLEQLRGRKDFGHYSVETEPNDEEITPMRSPTNGRQLIRHWMAALLPRNWFLVHGPKGCRSVCLTFDDGPDAEHTPRVLDVLKKEGVAATFFIIGRKAARYPELVRRIRAEGHVVGNHSYTHSAPHTVSSRQMLKEVRQTDHLLAKLLGNSPRLFRPPHGKLSGPMLLGLWALKKAVVLWNADPRDYSCRSPAEIDSWFERRPLRGGDVVLFHDNRPFVIAALPRLIASARRQGLGFSTIPEWI